MAELLDTARAAAETAARQSRGKLVESHRCGAAPADRMSNAGRAAQADVRLRLSGAPEAERF
ncbi:hypothetical protein [Mesorhizobium sp. STM 4661]|uniref:hypothetical protein n=1 Tax=Mesorhizobium sp. STM 4661 TaxID=1297570 RepID=UPI0002C01A8D|nr:hypothetical protein [Mesorhizobium sp. STM 4661]CCV10330.1 hypothetical protein MESS4_160048 [Mesorhizobium sp. STM 4661]